MLIPIVLTCQCDLLYNIRNKIKYNLKQKHMNKGKIFAFAGMSTLGAFAAIVFTLWGTSSAQTSTSHVLQVSDIATITTSNPGANYPAPTVAGADVSFDNSGISVFLAPSTTSTVMTDGSAPECGHVGIQEWKGATYQYKYADAGTWQKRRSPCNGVVVVGSSEAIGEQTLGITGTTIDGKSFTLSVNVPAMTGGSGSRRLYVDDTGSTYYCKTSDYNGAWPNECNLTPEQAMNPTYLARQGNGTSCGNNICQLGETYNSCSTDCPPPPPTCTLTATKTSYVIPEIVDYTYTCTSPTSVAVQVVKPDGTATTYNSSTNITTSSMGFETSNFTAGNYTLRICVNDSACSPSSLVSVPFTIIGGAPAAPTALTAVYSTVPNGPEVQLTVTDNANNETEYRAYWHLVGTAWPSTFNPTGTSTWSLSANLGRAQLMVPTPGGVYEYQLQACNSTGCSYSNIVSVNVPGSTTTSGASAPEPTNNDAGVWAQVDIASGQITSSAICTRSVCGLNGEYHGYVPPSSYVTGSTWWPTSKRYIWEMPGQAGYGSGTFNFSTNIFTVAGGTIYNGVFTPTPIVVVVSSSDSSLLGHWKFDGNGNNEVAGNPAAVTVGGGSEYKTSGGKIGGYAYVPSIGNYFKIPYNSMFDLPNSFTVEFWFRQRADRSFFQDLVYKGTPMNNYNFRIFRQLWNQYNFGPIITGYTAVGTGYWSQTSNGNQLAHNVWHHVAYTKDSTGSAYYLDGVLIHRLDTTQSSNSEYAGAARTGPNDVIICDSCIDTDIDDLKIYNRALGQSEITSIGGFPSQPQPVVVQAPAPQTTPPPTINTTGTTTIPSVINGQLPTSGSTTQFFVVPNVTPTTVPMPFAGAVNRECAVGEMPNWNNPCTMPMYHWNIAMKVFEKCDSAQTSMPNSTVTATNSRYTNCEPFNLDIEREWRTEKFKVHPPEIDGQWYSPPWDVASPMLQYNPTTDKLEACRMNNAPTPVGSAATYMAPCMPVPEIDRGWMIKRFRAEYKMFQTYSAQNLAMPIVNPTAVPNPATPELVQPPMPTTTTTVQAIGAGQCKGYISGLRNNIASDKKFWKDTKRQVSQVGKDYPESDVANKLLEESKVKIVEIEKLIKAGKCDKENLSELQTKTNELHSEIFAELSSMIPDMQSYLDLAYCKNDLSGKIGKLNMMVKNGLNSEEKRVVQDLIDETHLKLKELVGKSAEFEYDASFECREFSNNFESKVATLTMQNDKEVKRIVDEVVSRKLEPVIAQLTSQLEERGRKIDELLVKVAELHKAIESVNEAATKISESVAVSYSAMSRIAEKFAAVKTDMQSSKDSILPLIAQATDVMKAGKCLKQADMDRVIGQFGIIASVNWFGERGDEMTKRLNMFMSSCRAKEVTDSDILAFTGSVEDAAAKNQKAAFAQGVTKFADVSTHEWYFGAMQTASCTGAMTQGRPGENVLKQDALLMILRASGASESDIVGDCDLKAPGVLGVSKYAACAVNYASTKGVSMRGSMITPVSRIEVAKWINQLVDLPAGETSVDLSVYSDLSVLSRAESEAVKLLVANKIMLGNVSGSTAVFEPQAPLTRAALAVILEKLLTATGKTVPIGC